MRRSAVALLLLLTAACSGDRAPRVGDAIVLHRGTTPVPLARSLADLDAWVAAERSGDAAALARLRDARGVVLVEATTPCTLTQGSGSRCQVRIDRSAHSGFTGWCEADAVRATR